MPVKTTLDSNKIYLKEFAGTKPGYDALQVDSFLDIVVKDYETYEKYVENTDREIADLNKKIKFLQENLSTVEAENCSLRTKVSGIAPDQGASMNNLELIKKISALEKALQKLGVNPNTVEVL